MRVNYWIAAVINFGAIVSLAQSSAVRDTSLTAYTRTALTPLYYGLGTDRLGGARMETLDSGVVLKIIGQDSTGKLWRVRLSPVLTAYVPTEQVLIDTMAVYPMNSLVGNWTVYGDSIKAGADYVAVRMPARLPYRTQQQLNPTRLVVDVFGATANTNWITQLRSAREIRNVWFEQIADETFRIYIDLSHPQSWGYSIYYQRTTLMIRVRRPPARRTLRRLTIAVDAGHGGSNTGAKGQESGRFEKELTLDVAGCLQTLLKRAGAQVLMTRTTDTLIGPTARIVAMRQRLPDILVSIHFNSSGNQTVRGVSTYYKHVGFRPLSQAVLRELLNIGPAVHRPDEFGNVGHFNFFFNAPTEYPNVLVEGPFLSNTADEALILNEHFRQRMARAILRGLKKFVRSSL